MWLLIWKNELGEIKTNAFDFKCDCEDFADGIDSTPYSKVLYILYDSRA